jgi:hypothetical protein
MQTLRLLQTHGTLLHTLVRTHIEQRRGLLLFLDLGLTSLCNTLPSIQQKLKPKKGALQHTFNENLFNHVANAAVAVSPQDAEQSRLVFEK